MEYINSSDSISMTNNLGWNALRIALIVFLVVSVLPVPALADDDFEECHEEWHEDHEWDDDCPGFSFGFLKPIIRFFYTPQRAIVPGDFDAEPTFVELRTDRQSFWTTNATANANDSVDIRMNVHLGLRDHFDIDAAHASVVSYAEVYGKTNSGWQLITRIPEQIRTMGVSMDEHVTWFNAFNANSQYTQYRVVGYARAEGEPTFESKTAYLDSVASRPGTSTVSPSPTGPTRTVEHAELASDASCAAIFVSATGVTVPESSSVTKTFTIENDSSTRFFVREVRLTESSNAFDVSTGYFDPILTGFESSVAEAQIVSRSVSSTQSDSFRIQVVGEFEDGLSCPLGSVPTRTISVTVSNEGTDVAACGELTIETRSTVVGENDSVLQTYTIVNNSDSRFVISNVRLEEFDSDFAVEKVSNDSSVPAGGTAEVRVRVTTGTLDSDRSASFRLQLEGRFDNGENCSFSNLSKTMSVELNDSGTTNNLTVCRNIVLEAPSVRVRGGTTQSEFATLRNNSNKSFFIESVNVYDQSDSFSLSQTVFDSAAAANGGTASVWFGVEGFSTDSQRSGTGFVEVAGRFSDGDYCNFNAIGTKSFPVTVLAGSGGTSTEVCRNLTLNVPEKITLDNGSGRASISVSNSSSETVFLELSGRNLVVSPSVIGVPKGQTIRTNVLVAMLSGRTSNLEYRFRGPDCPTEIRFSSVEWPAEHASPSVSIVSAPDSLAFVDKVTIPVTMKNNSNISQTVQVALEGIPSAWTAEAPTHSFAANETRTVYLDMFSNTVRTTASAEIVLKVLGTIADRESIALSSVSSVSAAGDLRLEPRVQVLSENEALLTVQATNLSSSQLSGQMRVELPSDFEAPSQRSLVLNPGERGLFTFAIKPKTGNLREATGRVRAVLTDGRIAEASFAIPKPEAAGTPGFIAGLIGLGGIGSLALWLIFLLVLVAVLYAIFRGEYVKSNPSRRMHPPFSPVNK